MKTLLKIGLCGLLGIITGALFNDPFNWVAVGSFALGTLTGLVASL